jgi:hypothetical protein
MKLRKRLWLGLLASLALAPSTWGQMPGLPTPPVAPTAPANLGTPAPAAPTSNLWSFLCPTPAQKNACMTCFCNSPIGQLTSGAAGPMSAISGGLITNRCAANSIMNDLANQPLDSAEGAAAAIKQDEADAKARRAAVRYLGTVDCSYWPEATEALSLSLRADRNECVRFEAALSLRNGCCCNKKTIKALEMCVSGSDRDGHPVERSDRVRAVASEALARCPLVQEIESPDMNGEIKKTQYTPKVNPTEFYNRVEKMSHEEVAASARAVLASVKQGNQGLPSGTGPVVPPIHQRQGSLSGIFTNAFAPETVAKAPVASKTPLPQISLYEYLTSRNPTQEAMAPARSEPVGPARGLTVPRYNFSQPIAPAQFGTPSSGGSTLSTTGYLMIENFPSTQYAPLPTRP